MENDKQQDRIRELETQLAAATKRAEEAGKEIIALLEKIVALGADRDAALKRAEEAEALVRASLSILPDRSHTPAEVAHRERVAATLEHLGWLSPADRDSLRARLDDWIVRLTMQLEAVLGAKRTAESALSASQARLEEAQNANAGFVEDTRKAKEAAAEWARLYAESEKKLSASQAREGAMRAQAEALGLLADVVPSRWQLSRHKDEWFSLRVPTEALRQIRAALSLDAGKSAALVSSDGPRKLTREQVEEALKRGAASARGLDPKLRAVFSPPTDDLVLASVSPAEERRPASKVSDIADWQRRFRSAPAVWLVIDSDGIVTNAYDSAEGARLETTATRGRLRVQKMNIHDLRLATERWCNNFAPAEERRTPEQALTAEAMRRVPDRRERAADTRCPAHARLPGGEVIRCVRTDGHSTEHYYPTEEASWCWQGNSGDLAQIGPAPTRAEERREATTRGIAGDRCEPGNECGRLGCEECQR